MLENDKNIRVMGYWSVVFEKIIDSLVIRNPNFKIQIEKMIILCLK
jgi:hypothetical protein